MPNNRRPNTPLSLRGDSLSETTLPPHPLGEVEPTPSREALRLIVEVFRSGHRAAADLRHVAGSLDAGQLERELCAIEQGMLDQIGTICNHYRTVSPTITRH